MQLRENELGILDVEAQIVFKIVKYDVVNFDKENRQDDVHANTRECAQQFVYHK